MISFFRVIKFAFQGFFRNFWLSLVTITMMLMALFSTTLLIGIDYIKNATLEGVNKKVDILVSMKAKVDREDVELLAADLGLLTEVKKVTIITPEENKFLYEQSNLDEQAKQVLEIFTPDENPFSFSLAVQANNLSQYDTILEFINQDKYKAFVDNSDFNDFDTFVAKIENFSKVINKYSWYLIAAFLLISIVVIFNTIRISIYSRKEEVQIMKLVGASNWFIKTPFVLESILYALVSVVLLILIVYPIINFIQPSLTAYFQDVNVINLLDFFRSNFLNIFGLQFLVLALVNMLSTIIAIRKYLRI
ncbi:permease-like cell division protein FtsX [Patescibacteria group bacterium]|nr:permease-like cell division protein FtsX [Patescibacteria group bacterium]